MVSKTKYALDDATIQTLFRAAGLGDAADIRPLGAGEYSAVYSVAAAGAQYVLKVAPPAGVPVLTYEKDMMRAEVFWYAQMRAHTAIRVPRVVAADFDQKRIPTAYFIMEKLPGRQLDQMDLNKEEKQASVAALAEMTAQIHRIKQAGFGYIQNGLHPTWHGAIKAMAQAVVADAERMGKGSKRGRKLLAHIETYKDALNTAESCMVNFDIWAPNILCRRGESGMEYAWIDPERSFWGDPVADFVCLEFMAPLAKKTRSLQAYNAAADKPLTLSREEGLRYAVALGYLGLIMEVEKYYRYTPRHLGWWRNVLASGMLFRGAFGVLEGG